MKLIVQSLNMTVQKRCIATSYQTKTDKLKEMLIPGENNLMKLTRLSETEIKKEGICKIACKVTQYRDCTI